VVNTPTIRSRPQRGYYVKFIQYYSSQSITECTPTCRPMHMVWKFDFGTWRGVRDMLWGVFDTCLCWRGALHTSLCLWVVFNTILCWRGVFNTSVCWRDVFDTSPYSQGVSLPRVSRLVLNMSVLIMEILKYL
jgi:hypothetical protein